MILKSLSAKTEMTRTLYAPTQYPYSASHTKLKAIVRTFPSYFDDFSPLPLPRV